MSELARPLFPPAAAPDGPAIPVRRGDVRDGSVYQLPDHARLRVNVALATGRPLLVRGEPGTGKSTLAAYVAYTLGWSYREVVVTSRTEARDLMWRYHTLARLNDAQAHADRGAAAYVEPQALWWALSPQTAAGFGGRTHVDPFLTSGPDGGPPWPVREARDVVLIDEIDKADPEVPNDLLVAIGSLRFTVAETGDEIVGQRAPLLVFTTNAERDLPQAFLRRCITLTLETPTGQALEDIGKLHHPGLDPKLRAAVARRIEALREQARRAQLRKPSIAEYLDTLAACEQLGVTPDSPAWQALTTATMWKDEGEPA